jgi:hypothetical protein
MCGSGIFGRIDDSALKAKFYIESQQPFPKNFHKKIEWKIV